MRSGALLLRNRVACAALAFAPAVVACSRDADPPPPVEQQVGATNRGATHDDADPPLLVYVSEDGLTRLGGETLMDDTSILSRARDYQAAHPHGLAVVRCAPATIHGRATRIVALLEEAQIPSVAIDRVR